ncbi:hypothetical protein [Aureispira anguillae]|uniref:Uncharacterized protein n=1 Tax=Aureispira anguillae TaxID=2864201 RepID=A0A916DX82_9BACT|nr:hypothetical protein [Aureispira anguillae]BDS15490.1 hypothetical protein AsAng_0062740 [Aureispira anguillae]
MIAINPKNIQLAKSKYFQLINPVNQDGSYHKNEALIPRIKKQLDTCNNAHEANFWQYIIDNLESLLTSKLESLQTHIEELEKRFLVANISKNTVLKVFGYDNFRQSKKCQQLAQWLDIKVCPYCNENYTHVIRTEKHNAKEIIKLYFDFDHFLDKATYPYFSLSLFNLIPSCKICNSSCKGTKNFTPNSHINPYKEGFGNECKFTIKVKDVNFIIGNKESIALNLNVKEEIKNTAKGKRIQQNIDDLKLKERYQNHKDYALELIHKNIVYNEDYINSLYQQYEGTLFKNREDILRFIASNYIEEQDLGKRPLAKLTRDVVEGLDLI